MPEGRLSELIHTHLAIVPDEEAAHRLAGDLTARGHRQVRIRPAPGELGHWRVRSLVDEHAAGPAEEDHQAERETDAVGALARRHGGYREGGMTSLRADGFGAEDLVGLDPAEAHAVRRAITAEFPPPRPNPEPDAPLGGTPPTAHRPLFDVLRSVADSSWRSPAADAFADSGEVELVFEIGDSFMHQGSCYAHTAAGVPLIAALAARDDVRPALRAALLHFLFLAATAGRRGAAADADRRVSLGLSLDDEGPAEHAAREAVEGVAPGLLARWDGEGEVVCFTLAALAAACPGQGRELAGEIREWAESEGTATPRGRVLRLAATLAREGPGLDGMLASLVADGFVRRTPSPLAPAPGAAFIVLEEWTEKELSGVLEEL